MARQWNEEILAAILMDVPKPPVPARNPFHLAAGMHGAWAAYDSAAVRCVHHERAGALDDMGAARREAVGNAALTGCISGQSNFIRAAAEVLAAFTGSAFFPGGPGAFTAEANTCLVFERGPTAAVTLQWETCDDAADQADQSRLWGWLHVPEHDFEGRRVGAEFGWRAWAMGEVKVRKTGRCERRVFLGWFFFGIFFPDLFFLALLPAFYSPRG